MLFLVKYMRVYIKIMRTLAFYFCGEWGRGEKNKHERMRHPRNNNATLKKNSISEIQIMLICQESPQL